MVDIAVKGIGLGLLLSVLIGPVFFALIETSIKRGFISAFFFDVGILIGDATLIFIAYKSTSSIEINDSVMGYMKLAGGAIFMGFGLAKLLRKKPIPHGATLIAVEREHYLRSIVKGFVLNAANPAVLMFWLGVVLLAVAEYKEPLHALTFFAFILATLFVTDITKAWLAKKLRAYLSPMVVNRISRVLGIVFLACGVLMMADGLY